MRWDIFCRVIDNYGDAGVCWRLARALELAGEQVRLWIDEPLVLDQLEPADGRPPIKICPWPTDSQTFTAHDVADVVIEAFACDPPAGYVTAMADLALTGRAPVWINLEYLSAEDWIGSHHKMPSPHPRYPLVKHFYFPGFTPDSGGLIRESHISSDPKTPATCSPLRIFLFGYHQPALPGWISAQRNAVLAVAPGPLAKQMAALSAAIPEGCQIEWLPFVPQSTFDAVLQANDLLFVRGEDSFVRAQWAAKPVFWQIYPQADDAHLAKLSAFYERYLDPEILDSQRRSCFMRFILAWNGLADPAACSLLWPEILDLLPLLQQNALIWREKLLQQADLVSQLRAFVADLVK